MKAEVVIRDETYGKREIPCTLCGKDNMLTLVVWRTLDHTPIRYHLLCDGCVGRLRDAKGN